MNQIFNFKRYIWLVKRQWCENATIYKWGILLMVLVPDMLFWIINSWKIVYHPSSHLGVESTMVARTLFLYIFGALLFNYMSSRHKKMFYFSLPVSPLERIAVAFTFVVVLVPILYLSTTTVFNFVSVQLFDHIHETSLQTYFKFGLPLKPLFYNLTLCCIFVLGSLMFGKKGPIITLLVIVVFLFIYRWLWGLLEYNKIVNHNSVDNILYYIFPLCWVMMYFVMKRKEA